MPLSEPLVAELEQEAQSTRRVLERIPEDKLDWRPHPKSWSLGQLALHVAQLPDTVSQLAMRNMTEAPAFQQAAPNSKAEVLKTQDASVAKGKAALQKWSDAEMMEEWSLSVNGDTKMAMPRLGLLRAIMFNHLYHHRGQLLVYLRLLGEPVPAVYGVSADENPFMM
jgi:uncharacterized damage-inducible protein DinB